MKYLFIDASENITHVQTGTENEFSAKNIDTNRDFAAKITEICDNMLKEAGWEKTDLTHLVVCTGPGSLTGLRVADGFLRTLSMVLNIPLIGIDLFKWSMQTAVQNELAKAFNELRDEVAMSYFKQHYNDMTDKDKIDAVNKAVPVRISEAEPEEIK